ncbi:MAG: sialidase family protein [Clostridia bacterium]|nr:sialidase family protein [Clostridia bacterium]
MKNLPSRQELIDGGYPFGMAAPGIPFGDVSVEWKRTNPDIIFYKPEADSYDNDNEHFLVFRVAGSDCLYAVWTQSSCEGFGDNHLVFSSSPDGLTWKRPKYLTGFKPNVSDKQASWGFPVVSKKGRIYIFYTKQIEFYDNNTMSSGPMGCIYSDDLGNTWSNPSEIKMPPGPYDNPDRRFPKNWIVWQIPIRDASGRHIAGYTLVTSKALKKLHRMWVNTDSRSLFMRFENIDMNPEPGDILITWLPSDCCGLEVPNKNMTDMSVCQEPSMVLLEDGRLFTTLRTMTGYLYYSVSGDNGQTWRTPEILRYRDNGEGIKHPLSPGPIYKMGDGRFFILYHNNDGSRLGFSQFKDNWDFNEANFYRNPTFISTGTYMPDAYQPIWFNPPKKIFDTDDIAVGPKKTAETATYTSYIEWKGKKILWYPDRKFYLLGKYLDSWVLD